MTSHDVDDGLVAAWHRFLTAHRITSDAIVERIGRDHPDPRLTDRVATYLDEGPVAVALVAPHLGRRSRVLEVGSGIGIVSRFLAAEGHAVVATEPAPDGFRLMHDVAAAIDDLCGPVTGQGSLERLELGVDELDPDRLGRFDLVFSSNVLEHVPNPTRAVLHLHRFVSDDGSQAHVCPNYALPYDPHIARPLVPFVPAATRWILPARLRDAPEFRSVNFVTAGGIRRAAREAGLEVDFDRGLLAAALDRFEDDATFADRHSGLAPVVGALRTLRLDRLLRAVPPSFASPMRFTVRSGGSHRT